MGRRYEEKRNEVLRKAKRLYKEGNTQAAITLLEKAYETSQDYTFKKLLEQLHQQHLSMGDPMPQMEDDYDTGAPIPGQRVDHGQRSADITRRMRESSVSRGSTQGFLKEKFKTIYGIGRIATERLFKGPGKSIAEDATTMIAACKCHIRIDDIAGVCSFCNGTVCSRHFYECSECNAPVCNAHMKKFEGEPYCMPHYREKERERETLSHMWGKETPPPDSPLLRMWDNFWGRKQLPSGDEKE